MHGHENVLTTCGAFLIAGDLSHRGIKGSVSVSIATMLLVDFPTTEWMSDQGQVLHHVETVGLFQCLTQIFTANEADF